MCSKDLPGVKGSRSETVNECHARDRNRIVRRRANLPLGEFFSVYQIVLFTCQPEIVKDFFLGWLNFY